LQYHVPVLLASKSKRSLNLTPTTFRGEAILLLGRKVSGKEPIAKHLFVPIELQQRLDFGVKHFSLAAESATELELRHKPL